MNYEAKFTSLILLRNYSVVFDKSTYIIWVNMKTQALQIRAFVLPATTHLRRLLNNWWLAHHLAMFSNNPPIYSRMNFAFISKRSVLALGSPTFAFVSLSNTHTAFIILRGFVTSVVEMRMRAVILLLLLS